MCSPESLPAMSPCCPQTLTEGMNECFWARPTEAGESCPQAAVGTAAGGHHPHAHPVASQKGADFNQDERGSADPAEVTGFNL